MCTLVVAALPAGVAGASCVVPMTVGAMADYAGQVIRGEVASVRSYWTGEPRRIETEVVFTGVAYLKGAPADADDTFVLRVPGGTVGDVRMRIDGAPVFAAGESWVLFLLPEYRTHPVVGLDQGAFRIVRGADGAARVRRGGLAVTGLDTRGFVRTAAGDEGEAAMTYDRFVREVAPILAASRDHRLTAPAGRPAPARHRAAPLREASR